MIWRAAVLSRTWETKDNGEGLLIGPTLQHDLGQPGPEAKAVKRRVHLDIYARDLADLQTLGATIVEPPAWHPHLDGHGRS